MKRPLAIDWFRLIWDLVQRGMTLRAIASRTDIAEATLRGYLLGSHPVHWRGEALVDLWCIVCDNSRTGLPMVEVFIAPRVVDRKTGPATNDESIRELERAWR
jgi:hypothetical protein